MLIPREPGLIEAVYANRMSFLCFIEAALAHEFNNLICGISTYAIHVQDCKDAEKLAKAVKYAVDGSGKTAEFVKRFFDYSSFRGEVLTDPKDCIESFLPFVRKLMMRSRLEFRSGISATHKIAIPSWQFQAILQNLLSNAVLASEQGGKVVLDYRETNGAGVLTVTDTGSGVSPGIGNAIFAKGTTGWGPDERIENFMGLGLWIVRKLAEATDGTVGYENGPQGVAFAVTLPLA